MVARAESAIKFHSRRKSDLGNHVENTPSRLFERSVARQDFRHVFGICSCFTIYIFTYVSDLSYISLYFLLYIVGVIDFKFPNLSS
jgi:hypothetical protein